MDLHLLCLLLTVTVASQSPEDFPNVTTENAFIDDEMYTTDMAGDQDDEEVVISVYVKNSAGQMTPSKTYRVNQEHISFLNITLPEGLLVRNLSCLVHNYSRCDCAWFSPSLPVDAKSSTSILQNDGSVSEWHCISSADTKATRCQGEIDPNGGFLRVRVNVSLPGMWYLHTQHYDIENIAKLNPPLNIRTEVIAESLQIQWEKPFSELPDKCFQYQLRINGDMAKLEGVCTYAVPADLSRSYTVQLRVTKTTLCRKNDIWSDWSETVVVKASRRGGETDVWLISVIVLCVPMLALALLLLCRCRRASQFFSPVPGPSLKIKDYLERQNFKQATAHKNEEDVPTAEDGHRECHKSRRW